MSLKKLTEPDSKVSSDGQDEQNVKILAPMSSLMTMLVMTRMLFMIQFGLRVWVGNR